MSGVDSALAPGETIRQSVTAPHLFAKGTTAKRQVVTRGLTEVGQWMGQTRLLSKRLGARHERVTPNAITPLAPMPEVARRLVPQLGQWITTGGGAPGNMRHAGLPQARAIVRNTAGKKVACGVPSLLSRLGGGYLFGTGIRGLVDESTRP